MDKKIIFFLGIFISLLTIAGSISAIELVNPLNVNNFCALLTNIITAVAGLVGAISVIMIIVAGIMYLLSAGSPEKMTKAKTALIYAIVGLAIAISAGAIVATIKEVIGAQAGGC